MQKSDFPSPIQVYLDNLRNRIAANKEGKVATYIPELATADPSKLGICITMTDGTIYQTDDCETEFTIQSMSKPFTYGQALKKHGLDVVLSNVGVEPTGEAFNSIILDEENNRPFNPMVNAGAISIANLLLGPDSTSEMLLLFSRLAGRQLTINESVYQSELLTGHRNRAIAYMMLNTGMIKNEPEEVLKLYFQQCSINVSCKDMAIMAATMANLGKNPLTAEQVIEPAHVRNILTLMNTCGMYDYAGQWAFEVGVPAKSGVAGGIFAVIPGQAGISVWSPRLDEYGNSVRGVIVCKELSQKFGLHSFAKEANNTTVIRRSYNLGEIVSKRIRSLKETYFLNKSRNTAKIVELQGTLYFSSVEKVIRNLSDENTELKYILVDFSRVDYIEDAAACLLIEAFEEFIKQGRDVRISGVQQDKQIKAFKDIVLSQIPNIQVYADIDSALEFIENKTLASLLETYDTAKYALKGLDLLRGMSSSDYTVLESIIKVRSYAKGDRIITEGEEATEFFILANGLSDVMVETGQGHKKRLASLGPGASFGELALAEHGKRTADIVAAKASLCYVFPCKEVFKLSQTHPQILITLLSNMVGNMSTRLQSINKEVVKLQ